MKHRTPPWLARRIGITLACGLCVAAIGSALAQSVPNAAPNAGQLLNDQQKFERESSNRAQPQDLIQEIAPRAPIQLPEGMQIAVTRFRVTGNKSYDTATLGALVQAWEGRSLDVNGLNDAAGAITRHYQTNGFMLAYAYLPQQKIEQGVIELAVIEGTVDNVQIVTAQDVRLSDEAIQSYVQGISQTPQVVQADLERRLLLLNDIPGIEARASFAPGAKPGTADVIVTVAEEEPLAYSLDFNNQGSASTGEYRMGAQFHLKNLFGLGDSTRLRLQTGPRVELTTGSLNTRVPLGGQGWSADFGVSRLTYELGAPYYSLGARGEATTFHAGLAYALLRGVEDNISFNAGYDYKDLTDVLELATTNNKKHSQQLGLGITASSRDGFAGGGATQTAVNFFTGTLDWSSVRPIDSNAGSFNKLTFDISRRQFVATDWSALVRWSGQSAFNNLDSSEKFSLTGPYGVRAYAPGLSSVDSGSVLSLEVRRALVMTGGTLSLNFFYDFADGYFDLTPAAGVDNRAPLRGHGVGVSWSTGADLDISATLSWRDTTMLSAEADRVPYLYFQLTKGF